MGRTSLEMHAAFTAFTAFEGPLQHEAAGQDAGAYFARWSRHAKSRRPPSIGPMQRIEISTCPARLSFGAFKDVLRAVCLCCACLHGLLQT